MVFFTAIMMLCVGLITLKIFIIQIGSLTFIFFLQMPCPSFLLAQVIFIQSNLNPYKYLYMTKKSNLDSVIVFRYSSSREVAIRNFIKKKYNFTMSQLIRQLLDSYFSRIPVSSDDQS